MICNHKFKYYNGEKDADIDVNYYACLLCGVKRALDTDGQVAKIDDGGEYIIIKPNEGNK